MIVSLFLNVRMKKEITIIMPRSLSLCLIAFAELEHPTEYIIKLDNHEIPSEKAIGSFFALLNDLTQYFVNRI